MSTRILDNRFELEKQLSHTDFSTVYLGCDRKHFQRPACLVIGLRYQQPEMRYRLEREAQVLERLGQTPQMPKVLAYFNRPASHSSSSHASSSHAAGKSAVSKKRKETPAQGAESRGTEGDGNDVIDPDHSDQDTFYIVQEHLIGHPISQEITPHKKLSESYVVKLLQDTLTALAVAHNQGVVHQNLHPQHIIRQDLDGQIFLTHFGTLYKLAKSKLTKDGGLRISVPVSPHPYLSPEQRRADYNQQPQPASDLYALGLIAIEALTGQPHYHLTYHPTNGLQWRDQVEVSLPIAEFIDRLVRHDWKDRFADAQSALDTLVLVSDRFRVAHDSRLPTVVAAPGGRIPAQLGTIRSTSFRFNPSANAASDLGYSAGSYSTFKPANPYLLKLFIASLAVLVALGVGVKAYQWGQQRFAQVSPTWESWKTPSDLRFPQASSEDLVPLLADGSIRLRESAASSFWDMVAAAENAGVALYPLAGYRSADDAATLSEKEEIEQTDYPTGYAVDIGGIDAATDWDVSFTQTDAFQWLAQNAQTYGFELSLPEDGLTGGLTSKEPWHWRYVDDQDSRETFGKDRA